MRPEINAIQRMDEDLRSATNLLSLSGINPDYDDTVVIMRLTVLYHQRLALEKQASLGNLKRPKDGDKFGAFEASPHDVPTQNDKDLPLPVHRPKAPKDARRYPLAAPRQRKRKRSAENSGVVNTKEDVDALQQTNSYVDVEEDKLMTPPPRKRRRPIVVERSTRVLRARNTVEALDVSVLSSSNTVPQNAAPTQD